jgi:hypothetical protein
MGLNIINTSRAFQPNLLTGLSMPDKPILTDKLPAFFPFPTSDSL